MTAETFTDRFADKVTALVGSWKFIIWQSAILLIWIILNSNALVNFDPYPFILLNLVLSFEAAYTAPFILMSANRASARDRLMLEEDLAVDRREEVDIHTILLRLDQLSDQIASLKPHGTR